MAAKDSFVHRHQDTVIAEDHLDVWKRIPRGEKDATIQIDQADGVTAAVSLPDGACPGPGPRDPRSGRPGSPDSVRWRAAGAEPVDQARLDTKKARPVRWARPFRMACGA